MASNCRVCGRSIEGVGDICEACKENIRAEAMGRHRKVAKQTPTKAEKRGIHDSKGEEDTPAQTTPHDEEDKKPHHFKSMADYLKYLKGKEGN